MMTWRRGWSIFAAALALPGAAGSATPAIARLQAIAAASDANDCQPALRDGAALVDSPRVGGLPDELATIAYKIVVICEARAGLAERARAHALGATDAGLASVAVWHTRLGLDFERHAYDDAVGTLEAMRNRHGAALNAVDPRWMQQLHRVLDDTTHEALRERFLKLAVNAYAPDALFTSTDYYRLRYAGMLDARGDDAAARAMIRAIDHPAFLMKISVDPRFRAMLPPDFDIRELSERQLAEDRAQQEAHPDRLEGLNVVASDLRALGRPQEALDLTESAAALVDTPGRFSDRVLQLAWWWDARARSLLKLGRYEEAVASFEKGAALDEGGEPNISQAINLAAAHNKFGRGDRAVKALAAFDDGKHRGSPYGEMELRLERGCAQAISGNARAAAAELDYMRAHDKDHREALGDLLLCIGDLDGAAAAFIARLDDPERRADALLQHSDYDPAPPTDRAGPFSARLPALKARADVAAAIARAGGIRRFRMQADEL